MDNENQQKLNNQFFNKLFFEFNSISNIKVNNKFFKKTNHIYCSKTYNIWFARGEDENKYYYMFGSFKKDIRMIETDDYFLMIDFSKNEEFCDDCIGILTKTNIYFHKNNFIKKYPNFNIKDYNIKNLFFPARFNKQIEAIEIETIDNFINFLKKIIKEDDLKVKSNQKTLDDETKVRMNLFFNAIESGKDFEHSLKIAKISENELNSWLKAAENKDENYIDFYNKYYELIYTGKSKTANDNLINEYYELLNKNKTIDFGDNLPKKIKIKMNVFINAYKENRNLKYALKLSNLDKNLFYEWIEEGKTPNNKYHLFYKEYTSIRETPKIKVNTNTASKNERLMNEFIRLKHEGKTNKEIYQIIDIPRHLIKNWRNQGQMGNKKYKEFYEAYILDNNPKPEPDNETIVQKTPKKTIPITIEKNTDSTKRKCKICGRKLHEKHQKDLCNRCLKKQYAVKILGEILSIVEPGIAFRKEDLEILNLSKIKIKDYIWTLKDFDLIIEDKSKIILKDMDILNKFAEDCESKIEIKENTSKLNKTCETCGQNLEISNFFKSNDYEDGYEDNCKNCKKLINSAIFLKELTNYVNWESEFLIDDIKSNFQDPFILQGNIWNLADSDLVINNHESNTYTLTNKINGEAFIKKYYQKQKKIYKKEAETPKIEPQIKPIKNYESSPKKEQMEIVLKEMKKRRSRKEAAIIANIPLYKITHWYNEGHNRFGEDNINFYKKLSKIENRVNPYTTEEIKDQINNFLNSFRETKDKELSSQRINISTEDIDNWILLGEKDINPYNSFLDELNEINSNIEISKIEVNSDIKEFNIPINTTKRKIFLEYIRTGSSIQKGCEQADLDKNLVITWIMKGKKEISPFNEFYNKYHKYNGKDIEIDFKKEYNNKNNKLKRKKLLNEFENGKSLEEACESSSLNINILNIWIEKGKENKKPYVEFFNEYENAKNNNLKNQFLSIENISKRKLILDQLKLGKSAEESCKYVSLDFNLFEKWISEGKKYKEPYYSFYKEYNEIISIKHDIEEYERSINNTKRRIFLEYMRTDHTIEKSCVQASLEKDLLNKWLELGKNNINPFNGFYNKYMQLVNNKFSEEKRNEFLNYIEKGYSKIDAAEKIDININLINEWLKKGNDGEEHYIEFLKSYNKSKVISNDNNEFKIQNDIIKYLENGLSFNDAAKQYKDGDYEKEILNWYEYGKYNDEKYKPFYDNVNKHLPNFFDLIKEGYSVKIACKRANLNFNEVKDKIITPNEEFLNKLIESKILNKIDNYPKINHKKGNERTANLMNEIIKLTIKGYSDKQICQIIDLPYETFNNWIQRGINNIGVIYIEFYNCVNKINKMKEDIKNTLIESFSQPDILDILSHKYNNFYSTDTTGFAWVKKRDDSWIYTRSSSGKIYNYSHEDIRELFKIVIEKNQLWGVRDIEKAKETLKNPIINKTYLENSEEKNDDILNQLSEEIKNELIQNNEKFDSGFAWVNQKNNQWVYSKEINGIAISIHDEYINNLFKKVKTQGLEWGVYDLDNAIYSVENNKIPDTKLDESDEKNILKLLPEDIEKELSKYSKGNKTGFAWVNKIGDQWIYSRKINNKNIRITDENIYNLFKTVIENNYTWGVRDLNKAKKTLNKQDKHHKLETEKSSPQIKTIEMDNYDILNPLPEEYKSAFKSAKTSKSGFAWVNKNGHQWQYAGIINGKYVEIKDPNIFNLHKKVISQNLIWGVRDLNNAKKTIENEEKQDYIEEIKETYDISVNYLTKNELNINILIKGIIENNQLFPTLSKFYIFEEYIKRILTNKTNNKIDILIELDLDINLLSKFEKEIKSLGWKIN